MEAGMQNEIIL